MLPKNPDRKPWAYTRKYSNGFFGRLLKDGGRGCGRGAVADYHPAVSKDFCHLLAYKRWRGI